MLNLPFTEGFFVQDRLPVCSTFVVWKQAYEKNCFYRRILPAGKPFSFYFNETDPGHQDRHPDDKGKMGTGT